MFDPISARDVVSDPLSALMPDMVSGPEVCDCRACLFFAGIQSPQNGQRLLHVALRRQGAESVFGIPGR